ncbi:hypothetical protein [Smaragdicoccus niigatensis]|uniref:hypothetical protein n=1 Tax=Smaragdicoccus niigatensis TaxID=359359 RepID=UPI00036FC785|nr:hypothetical protein [Smaragdicoccus niigatensis]
MTLETDTNKTVESLKEASRELAALVDVIGEQVRPAVKFTVDRVDEIAAVFASEAPAPTAPIEFEAKSTKDELDAVARDFGALADAIGDQLRPAIKVAVTAADGIASAVESVRTRLWKSMIDLGATPAV